MCDEVHGIEKLKIPISGIRGRPLLWYKCLGSTY